METQTIEQPQQVAVEQPQSTQQVALAGDAGMAATQSETMYLDAIRAIATNPDVDVNKLPILLDVQERMLNRQAETHFTQDFIRMSDDIPRIRQDKRIEHKGKKISGYASYEKIDEVLRPILKKYGFALSFSTHYDAKYIHVDGTLMHKSGHKKVNEVRIESDTSGAKNNVQGVGSALSYGKRYCVSLLLNLVFEGEDDDGQAGGMQTITDEQSAELKGMIEECFNLGKPVDMPKFLHYVDADNIDQIQLSNFTKAKTALSGKIKQAKEAGNDVADIGNNDAQSSVENVGG